MGSGLAVAIVVNLRRGEDGADGLSALVSRIHGEDVANGCDAEFIFVSEIQAVETIDELRAISHSNFFGMTIENVEGHAAEDGVAQGGNLFQLIAGSCFAAGF